MDSVIAVVGAVVIAWCVLAALTALTVGAVARHRERGYPRDEEGGGHV